MYIQRIPHPLAHFGRSFNSNPHVLSINGTTVSSVSQPKPHPTGYVVLAVVLAILLLSLAGVFIARRRVGSLLLCAKKRNKENEKSESPPRMRREGRTRFTHSFDVKLSSQTRTHSSGSSATPSSPCSEGPSTPATEDHERGDISSNSSVDYAKTECSFVPIPIIVHTPSQTHQTTFLTGPNSISSPDLTAPTAHHEHFFDERSPMTAHGSVIRPHGLPLSPVPEESSAIISLSSHYFEVDEETLYGTNQDHSTQ